MTSFSHSHSLTIDLNAIQGTGSDLLEHIATRIRAKAHISSCTADLTTLEFEGGPFGYLVFGFFSFMVPFERGSIELTPQSGGLARLDYRLIYRHTYLLVFLCAALFNTLPGLWLVAPVVAAVAIYGPPLWFRGFLEASFKHLESEHVSERESAS